MRFSKPCLNSNIKTMKPLKASQKSLQKPLSTTRTAINLSENSKVIKMPSKINIIKYTSLLSGILILILIFLYVRKDT